MQRSTPYSTPSSSGASAHRAATPPPRTTTPGSRAPAPSAAGIAAAPAANNATADSNANASDTTAADAASAPAQASDTTAADAASAPAQAAAITATANAKEPGLSGHADIASLAGTAGTWLCSFTPSAHREGGKSGTRTRAGCGRAFATQQERDKHARTAHGEHLCVHCPATFRSSNGLKSHTRGHHAEASSHLQYGCLHCGRAFDTVRKLNKHLDSSHERVKAHQCPFCIAGFVLAQELASHVSSIHGKTLARDLLAQQTQAFLNTVDLYCGAADSDNKGAGAASAGAGTSKVA